MFSTPLQAAAVDADEAIVSAAPCCLLKTPPPLTEAENQERLNLTLSSPGALEMQWTSADRKLSLGFDYQNRTLGMQIHAKGEIPPELSVVKHLFTLSNEGGKEIWLYTYGARSPADLPQQVSAVLAPLEESDGDCAQSS